MEIKEFRVFNKNIKRLDPNEEFVKIDVEAKQVKYSEKIIQHRKISELTPEEIVRAYLVIKLITQLKYSPDCIELEKEHVIGRRKKKTAARIDVLIKRPDNSFETFMIIEVKAPEEYEREYQEIRTQLFEVAKLEKGTQYLIYYTAYVTEQELKEKLTSISYSRYDSYSGWESEGKPNLMGIPQEYAIIKKPVFTKGGVPDLRKDVDKNELERIRKELHDVLWGGGRYHGNEIFVFIMKMFLAKIHDEKETENKRAYKFQIFYEDGNQEDPKSTHKRVNELYKDALRDYIHLPNSEIKGNDVRKIGDKTVELNKFKYVVEAFQDISLTTNIYDVLGNFFERFLWDEFKQSKGQFFTHQNIVNFIIGGLGIEDLSLELVNEEARLPRIIDPACGSGTFLIESMKRVSNYIRSNLGSLKDSARVKEFAAINFPELKQHAWAERFIYGVDNNEDLAMATKVNMVMHGDGASNIESEDALSDFDNFNIDVLKKKSTSSVYGKPVNEQMDIVISNPPFSINIPSQLKQDLPKSFLYASNGGSENLFVERWFQLLRENGRLGVILPESFFDTEENRYIRLFLFKYFEIKAIISLPTVTFDPFTQTRTGILFAQKKNKESVELYERTWQKHREKFDNLKKEFDNITKQKQGSLIDSEESIKEKYIAIIKELAREEFKEQHSSLRLNELKEIYSSSVSRCDAEWWVFAKVSQELDYDFFMAIAEEVGYKRTKRSERERPNDLINILIDMRQKVKWEPTS